MDDRPGFGLYVHWPFCQAKCPYCDFNSHVAATIDHDRWNRAYLRELDRAAEETGGRVLNSIFFGGGTPSLMSAQTVSEIIAKAYSIWKPANDIEITLEANPTSSEAARFRDYASAGVNRVSIGVQSLRDEDLRKLGRLHTADEALRACEMARETFARASFDLIYARQDQTLGDWETELREALAFAPDHLSLYQLTIEPGTAFGDRLARGRLRGLPSEDLAADMYDLTQEITGGAGLPAYEISNHARPGQESIHNMIYWRSGDWVGIGPGAHGRLTFGEKRFATSTQLAPGAWLSAVETGDGGELPRDELSRCEIYEEAVMMGLRVSGGIAEQFLDNRNKINMLVTDGLIERHEGMIRTTARGRPLLNAILRELLA